MSAKAGANGKIDASMIKTAIQQHNQAVSSMASLSLMTWRQENNEMNKRLGEVGASEGSQGIWARMARGQSKYGSRASRTSIKASSHGKRLMRGCFLHRSRLFLITCLKQCTACGRGALAMDKQA